MNKAARNPRDSVGAGVYAAPTMVDSVKQRVVADRLQWFDLDLDGVSDKTAFLNRCAEAFELPETFGRNWDALADCLEDLGWHAAPGYVVHVRRGPEFARRAPRDLAVALEILEDAASYWSMHEKTFVVLIDADSAGGRLLKPLPE
jgi:RNAse (barnase) inhibitor barstar